MHISIVSVFKDLYTPFLDTSLVKKAQEAGKVSVETASFFDFVAPKERIDSPSFGPGAGMLIKPQVVQKAIDHLQNGREKAYKIFFSPHGKKLTQPLLAQIAQKAMEKKHLMLLPARYEGMDARVEQEYADEIISVGDFVLMGGDLPAMMLLEGLLRHVPGVIGKKESVEQDSFTGPFVDYPEFTEPVLWKGMEVPPIIRSGNHGEIEKWRLNEAAKRTVMGHFSWLRSYPELTVQQEALAKKYIPNHYVALMHDQVLLGSDQQVGTSSVMTIDIHDIARSCKTYGVKNYFIVSPLDDQQRVVNHFLSFWQSKGGQAYNPNRFAAHESTQVVDNLQAVCEAIEAQEGQKPILVATSARPVEGKPSISYNDQGIVWKSERPVLLLFGTAQGLAPELLSQCDYILEPVKGFSGFNHLSVRSAAGIILDRWLGRR